MHDVCYIVNEQNKLTMYNLGNLLQDLKLEENNEVRSIVFKHDFDNPLIDLSAEIIDKLKSLSPDATYYFNFTPLILFYDFTNSENSEIVENFHTQVWCFDKAPIVIALYQNSVEVFNAFQFVKSNNKLENLNMPLSQIIEEFSFWKLQTGKTWEWLEETSISEKKKRVNQKLFENIKELRRILTDEQYLDCLNEKDANILILRLIFARYLIDRKVSIVGHIEGKTLDEKRESFNNLIANKNKLSTFFRHLKDRFYDNDLFIKEIDISERLLASLSEIFSGKRNLYNPELFYFDIFDFNIISVETISGIYESVISPEIRKDNAAVYTPSFLVDYILKETVDRHLAHNSSCKILDPACGSGIFLVQAFRRMVYKLPVNQRSQKNKLIKIAQENLYGIDKDINALNVAVFSIYVAILDFIQPVEIMDVPLPKLKGKNLFRNDFFNEEDEIFDDDTENFDPYNEILNPPKKGNFKTFDFILGNPPWSKKNDAEKDRLHLKYIAKFKLPVAGGEIAQTFLYRSRDFMAESTSCAMIVTSKAFYNDKSKNFKKDFLRRFLVDKFFDLSPVRHILFENGDYPATVIMFKLGSKYAIEKHSVEHLSLKPNLFLKSFQMLVIDNQDIKKIKQQNLIDNDWALKTALYGNNFDFQFLKRLIRIKNSTRQTIADYLKISHPDFESGDGINKGNGKDFYPDLVGKPLINHKNLQMYYTEINSDTYCLEEKDVWLERGRGKELFKGDHLYLKATPKNEESIFVSFCHNEAVHTHGIYGISSGTKIEKLKEIYGAFLSKLFTYYTFMTSSAVGVGRPDVRLAEYFSFPFFEEDNTNLVEAVDEFINVYREIYSKLDSKTVSIPKPESLESYHKINEIISNIYDLGEVEEALIDYSLNISRYQFIPSKAKKYIRKPTDEEYEQYADVFYNHFYHVFKQSNLSFSIKIFRLQYFTAMKFVVSENELDNGVIFEKDNYTEEQVFSLLANTLSITRISNEIFINKRIRGFEKDFFYIIKPNEYKSWHKATAFADVAEFEKALFMADLNRIKKGGEVYA